MFLLLLMNAVTMRRQLSEQLDSHAWVSHTREVLYEISQTESLLKDAERGQRGYLYTDEHKYLDSYLNSTQTISQHLDHLAQLTPDNPQQVRRISTLRPLVTQKLAELQTTIALFEAGKKDAAKSIVQSDLGRQKMETIQSLLEEMRREELKLEKQRAATYQSDVHTTVRTLYITTVIRLIALSLLALFVLYQMALRHRHAQQLLDREEWFRVTLTSLGDAVIATDAKGCIAYLNPLAEQLIGITSREAIGQQIHKVFPIFNEVTLEPAENPIKKVMEQGLIVGLANHTVLRNMADEFIPIEDSASPIRDLKGNLIGAVLVFRDATHERKTQERLRESEKLAAAARMSATVAHEINNPLESVGNLIYLARNTEGLPSSALDHLLIAERELERVAHIAKQTLGFYREFRHPEVIDLPSLIDSVVQLCNHKIVTKYITVHRNFALCPSVQGIPGELKQVFSNLIQNAADAAPEHGNIWISISCAETIDAAVAPNKEICIEIKDDGPGISDHNANRIFDAFFTTKKNVGNGLGLWVTKEIVERHHGSITLLPRGSDMATGATFQIFLPEHTEN